MLNQRSNWAIVWKRLRICASHSIPNHPGKCRRLHGHNYTIEVGIMGPIDPDTGMVKDFYEIKQDLTEVIDQKCDHQHLNDIYPDMLTTAENLAARWLQELSERDSRYWGIRVYETDDSWVECHNADYYAPEESDANES